MSRPPSRSSPLCFVRSQTLELSGGQWLVPPAEPRGTGGRQRAVAAPPTAGSWEGGKGLGPGVQGSLLMEFPSWLIDY